MQALPSQLTKAIVTGVGQQEWSPTPAFALLPATMLQCGKCWHLDIGFLSF